MWRLVLLLTLAQLLISGCSHEVVVPPEPTDTPVPLEPNSLVLDSAFTAEETEAILLAISEWFAACPDLQRPVLIGDDPNVVNGWPDGYELESEAGLRVGTTTRNVRTWIHTEGVEATGSDLRLVVLHELGHLFGIKGHIESGNVMAESVETQADALTESDINEMRSQANLCINP